MSMFSTIICCRNLNENPEVLVDYVCDTVRVNDARLILTYIIPSREQMERKTSRDDSYLENIYAESRERIIEDVNSFSKKHFASLMPIVEIIEGREDEEMLKLIDRYCADLVITGSITTKSFRFFGINANKSLDNIIGRSRIPVMIIPNELNLECVPSF